MSPRRKRLIETAPEAAAAARVPLIVGEGVRLAMQQLGDVPRSHEGYVKDEAGNLLYSLTQGKLATYFYDAIDNEVRVQRREAVPAAPPTPTPPPPDVPGPFLAALDVSSHQGMDISAVVRQFSPDHVIVKLYQSIELGGDGAKYSVAQAHTARSLGCTTGGYVWLYANVDGAKQVIDALATADRAAVAFSQYNPLWLDCERYTDGSNPSVEVIHQAVAECQRRHVPCGIYTGAWWWKPYTGNSTAFMKLPLWAAVYDGKAEMVDVAFGGWRTLAGKQWTSTPVDRNVFRSKW